MPVTVPNVPPLPETERLRYQVAVLTAELLARTAQVEHLEAIVRAVKVEVEEPGHITRAELRPILERVRVALGPYG